MNECSQDYKDNCSNFLKVAEIHHIKFNIKRGCNKYEPCYNHHRYPEQFMMRENTMSIQRAKTLRPDASLPLDQ